IILNNWWSNHAAWPTHWILTDGMEDQTTMDQLRSGGVNTTGLIGPSPTRSPTATGINAYERFRSAFATRFGSDPVILSENAYDSAFVLALAMHASGSTNPELFRRAIRYVANPPGMMILPGQWAQAVAALDAGQDIDYWGAANRVDWGTWANATGTSNWSFEWNTTGLADGPHDIGARSFDGANYSAEETVAFAVDNTPPTLTITLPVAGGYVASRVLSVAWYTADSFSGIETIAIQLDAQSPVILPGTAIGISLGPAADGPHTVLIRSTDRAGNVRSASVSSTADGPA